MNDFEFLRERIKWANLTYCPEEAQKYIRRFVVSFNNATREEAMLACSQQLKELTK